MSVIARKPGQYAAERYERGVRSYRGRLYRYAARFIVIAVAVELAIALVLRNTIGWAMFAFVIGFLLGMVVTMREALPDHVRRWRDGTWGEQQTAKVLEPLEREGWTVTHDIELDRGNIDHLVESPSGRCFVLETKSLNGHIAVEDGVLTTTQIDDPEQIYRHTTLRHVVLERARAQYRERGRDGGWVQAAVVIWGDFAQGLVEDGKLVFLDGEQLVEWLRKRA